MIFLKLMAVLTFFVAGGLVAGLAMADIDIKSYNAGEAGIGGDGGTAPGGSAGEKDKKLVICLMGDVLLASGVGEAIDARGPDYPWREVADTIREAHIAIANLECAVSTRGSPDPDKEYTFRASPQALDGAAKAGMDVFTLANNHVLDYGQVALMDTISSLRERNMTAAGAGMDENEAADPAVVDMGGKRVAVLAFTRIIPRSNWIATADRPGLASGHNYHLMLEKVQATEGEADITVVSMHWGNETEDFPDKEEVSLAHSLVDAGADIIVGHHPHVLQGIEIYKGKIIAYSLGNFIFTISSQKAREGAILQVYAGGGDGCEARIIPTYIEEGAARILKGADRKRVLERINSLCDPFNTTVDGKGELQRAQ